MSELIAAIVSALIAVITLLFNRKDAKDEKKNEKQKEVYIAPDSPVNEYNAARERVRKYDEACACSKPPEPENDIQSPS